MEDLRFDHRAYSEYMDDINYSQGFYVTPPEDGSLMLAGIRRVEHSDERFRKAAECATKFAVEERNKKAGKEGFLKFVKIINLNVEPSAGAVYYTTAALVEADGETCRYQLKIWEKLNTGYQVQLFRPAPYWLKFADKVAHNNYRVAIHNLMPWMDENYLYYKCFFANPQVVGVEVVGSEQEKVKTAYVWLRNSAQVEGIVNKYIGRKMPRSDMFFTFELTSH